ncbi:hypothetical protein [Streptacidiphilus albus]|uniref:hypothetical protein n=1 Tax=Streptacidiphilus albus TaxID=105425 RepID=UPI00054B1F01|nr:hypothetical protein [Streptacidiphilus albus]
MGIESDQIVYDYLSRVGDLAQATSLTAAERSRLVAGLRQDIDGRRGGSSGADRAETSAVRKILSGLGTPDEVVRQAVHGGVPGAEPEGEAAQRPAVPRPGPSIPWRYTVSPADLPVPPEPAGSAEPAGPGADPGSGSGAGGGGGFVGGGRAGTYGPEMPGWSATYSPDFLGLEEEPGPGVPAPRQPVEDDFDEGAAAEQDGTAGDAAAEPRGSLLRRLLRPSGRRPAAAPSAPRGRLPLVEALAALVLASGAVLDLWYVVLLGWFFAYSARRLGLSTARVASIWIPVAAALVFGFQLYSQVHGHQLSNDAARSALTSAAGLWLRTSAGCSALYLAWRISRR